MFGRAVRHANFSAADFAIHEQVITGMCPKSIEMHEHNTLNLSGEQPLM